MTEREAINAFDGLRKAFRSIKPGEQVAAQNVLARTHVIPSGLLQDFVSALGTLRAVFDEIEKWETRNPSN
jgi:hypothetical protein